MSTMYWLFSKQIDLNPVYIHHHYYFRSMSSSAQKPEVVTSAAYHADTDDEDFDVKTSAVMDYDADTDDEGFASPAVASLTAANDYVSKFGLNSLKVCPEIEAAGTEHSVRSGKRKQTSPEKEEEERPAENAASQWNSGYIKCCTQGCTNAAVNGVEILNYLAVTAPSDELFESVLADMQTLGVAIPQHSCISNARNIRNIFNVVHGKISSPHRLDDSNAGGGSNVNSSIQLSATIDYDANKDDEGFSSLSAAVDENITNISGLDRLLEVCQEVGAPNKRKQPTPEEEDRPPGRAAKKRYSKKKCSAEGCTNQAYKGGVCSKHGAKRKLCGSAGCTNQALKGGVCQRHGAKVKLCSNEGCSNQVQGEGLCRRHGAKKNECSREGCTNKVRKGGVCRRHGGKDKLCNSKGCTNQAVRGGVCFRHGAKRKRCSQEGCTNQAYAGGVCFRHGAKSKICSSEGCSNKAVQGGVCVRHGARVARCITEGCTNQVVRRGVCKRHGFAGKTL